MSSLTHHEYWKSLEERDRDPATIASGEQEFADTPLSLGDVRMGRRGFMKAFAAAFAAAALAGCKRSPVHLAIPFLIQPEEVVPGRSLWYATTCGGCPSSCGVLAKCRDGRPIKLEGNPEHPLSQGGLCATGQAEVLSLYDPARLRAPRLRGKKASWAEVDGAVTGALEGLRGSGAVRLLTGTISSPTERAAVAAFLARFADARHIVYDPLSVAAILEAHARTHGRRVLPRYRLENARAIASFDADFLGTWISPVEFTAGYRAGRTLADSPPALSYHAQVEARLSLTGTNADRRVRVAPGEIGAAVAHVAAGLAKKAGVELTRGVSGSLGFDLGRLGPSPFEPSVEAEIVERLFAARGEAVVLCGLNDPDVQTVVNLANHILGAYGTAVDIQTPSRQQEGDERGVAALVMEMAAGKVAALLVCGVNPVYDATGAGAFAAALTRVPLAIAFSTHLDETARLCQVVSPVPHFLEAWGDVEPVSGLISLRQPAIAPLGDTRPFAVSLARWSQDERSERDLVKASVTGRGIAFEKAVHDGFAQDPSGAAAGDAPQLDLTKVAAAIPRRDPGAGRLALVLYPSVAIRDGRHALNPWLQELPDPVTKTVWDNVACLSPATAAALGVTNGAVVRISGWPAGAAADASIELPVLVQAGQHDGAVAVALGYGRAGTERFAGVGPSWLEGKPTVEPGARVGVNAASFLEAPFGFASTSGLAVTVAPTGRRSEVAVTQDHHSLVIPKKLAQPGHERRPHVQVTTLPAYVKDRYAGEGDEASEEARSLWPDDHRSAGPRWSMAIDLNACTGCGACVVACQAENNIPVVGKDEVRRHREMHWMRIDRYYAGESDDLETVHQPMLCHHCGNAPCETVCPVLATVHGNGGLNQQVYNRCVGTRYCANNCPFKVRRFNWFDYAHDDLLQNLVLNPDVTVRSRGVMEKCSFCVQRIQEAKIEASRAGIPLADGAVRPACEQSCPAKAIVFGDLHDANSSVCKTKTDPRYYEVIPELNLSPAVGYLRRVRNRDERGEAAGAPGAGTEDGRRG